MKSKLRVGLLIDDFEVPAWVYKMIADIAASHYATLSLVVKNKKKPVARSFAERVRSSSKHLAYLMYRRLETKLFHGDPDAFKPEDVSGLLAGVPLIEVAAIEKKHSDYFETEDIEKIKAFEIDVFIRLGFRILKGEVLGIGKCGIWSFHHGDNFVNRGGPAGVWEVLKPVNNTGSILQILSEDLDNGQVLYRSWSATDRSIIRNLNNSYWKTVSFLPRKLRQLYEVGAQSFIRQIEVENEKLSFYSERLYKTPENSEFLKLLIGHYVRWLKSKLWSLLNFEQWILLYSFSNKKVISASLFRYKKLIPPKDRIWADPCVIYRDQNYFVFFEELISKKGKAHISMLQMDSRGKMSSPVPVLKRPYHLSYPFVFESNGETFMVPETSENNSIEIYRSKKFPLEWEFEMTLMNNIEAVDTTILFHNGKYWLFTNIKENKGASFHDELFVFYSEDLLTTNWLPHQKNPVVSDVRRARPAGKLFSFHGALYRPSQDCSQRYGHRIVFNEVIVLNETEYEEQTVTSIGPEWDPQILGTHTFSHDEGLTFIDGVIKRRK